jgi:dipeptidase
MSVIKKLQRIVLERCTKARDAIRLIGDLIKEYGYGGRGECLTIADSKEVWHFKIMGGGPVEVGAVWAAVRIPDEQVGVSANIPRISELNVNDPDHYMASENFFSLAEEMEWWDPKSNEPFKFWKAYSGRRPYASREFYILSTLGPSLNLKWGVEELPFSVKPDKKLSVRDVMKYYRETYEGHEFDKLKNLFVKPRKRRGQSDEEYERKCNELIIWRIMR